MSRRPSRLLYLVPALLLLLLGVGEAQRRLADYAFAQSLRSHNWPAVRRQLLSKSNQHARSSERTTPLMIAAEAGDLVWIRRLLDQGTDIDAINGQWSSALDWAAGAGQHQAVSLLLDRGAAIEVDGTPGMDNNSPARVAFDHGDRKLAAEIGRREHLGKILLNMVQERRGSPQARASAVGDLIRHGAPSNSLDVNGTALRWAAEYRDLALAQQLLKLGTRPEADIGPMRNHAHPLEVSVARQDLKMTRLLLEQRADPRFASSAFPPLFGAAYRGDEAMVRLLLEFGADPNQGVDVGEPDGKQHRWTPLTEARRGGHRPIERILRDAGGR